MLGGLEKAEDSGVACSSSADPKSSAIRKIDLHQLRFWGVEEWNRGRRRRPAVYEFT